MMDLLPPHLKTMVKSSLRDARHLARKIGHAAKSNGARIDRRLPPGPGHVIGKIADYSDATLVTLETIALDILSGGRRTGPETAGLKPFDRYFAGALGESRRLLARDASATIKDVMRVKNVPVFRVRAASLEQAWDRTVAKMPAHARAALSVSGGNAPATTVALAAACLAQAIAEFLVVDEPPAFHDERRNRLQESGPYIAAVLAMTCAVLTCNRDLEEREDVCSAVCSAVDSRYALIAPHLAPDASPDALAVIFSGLLAHLP